MSKLDQATLAKIHSVRIHPPVGIARVGNSTADDGWFYGPEIPGQIDTPEGGFKDSSGAVKRQAARFRLYGFTENGQVVCELNGSNGFHLDWKLEVGNQKAAWYIFQSKDDSEAWKEGGTTLRNPTIQPNLPPEQRSQLYIRSGVKALSGPKHGPVYLDGQFTGSSKKTYDIRLGEARTDKEGHLVVLAGYGASRSVLKDDQPYPLILNDFDSPDWIDDTCDGWITVSATHNYSDKLFIPKHKARVLGCTPKFSTEVYAPTTLFDVMEDIYEAKRRTSPDYMKDLKVEWYRHIWPLLQRPPRLSWVNGQANNGHGFEGPGNFFNEGWQENLKDTSEANAPIRKGVLMRMRLPYDTKLTQARAGQAYTYFMPWLSGDGGRTTDGVPETFSSVTRLQYDRLTKWANGEFSVGNPLPTYERFEDIPLPGQPSALTRAALDATIGAPLYPGIEMSWNAEIPDNYELDELCTFADKLLPGDLTKYLSLPWQSDFYMCRSYWWPSARPDAIVTKEDYEEWLKKNHTLISAGKKTHKLKRVPWERGLRVNYTDQFGEQPLFANTDMVQFWHQLGFIVKPQHDTPTLNGLPVYVETQRGKIHVKSNVPAPALLLAPPNVEILAPPQHGASESIKSILGLQQHLQSAMAVELSTIPLYLFGMYTVKVPPEYKNDPRYVNPIISAVRNVVAEEMLHLSLAGNILKAIGGVPKLYHPNIIPKYPGNMLHRIPPLTLLLRAMTKKNLKTFIEIEKPEPHDAPAEPDRYHTLGQFYKAIKEGLANLNRDPNLFHPETAPFQFAPGLGYQARNRDAGGSVIVTDLQSAFLAIDTIVHQGEGDIGPCDDPAHLEKDHYAIFTELRDDHKIKWDTYPVINEPATEDYHNLDIRIYQVSRTFDAAYCFLLLTIEKLWDIEDSDARKQLVLGNMFTIMMGVLAPLAKFLITQRLPHPYHEYVAAPCFNYFDFKGRPALPQLLNEMQTALDAYLDVTEETPDQVTVHNYGAQLQVLLPIQNTMTALVDLDSFKTIASPVVKKTAFGINNIGAKGFGPVVL